ncbi:unnamed protein product, partial [Urochloa humidicola]
PPPGSPSLTVARQTAALFPVPAIPPHRSPPCSFSSSSPPPPPPLPTAAASGDDFRDGCPLALAPYYFTARRADLPDRQLLVRRQEGVSPRYGLFLTYPLWEGETLSPRRRSSTGSHRRRRWSSGGITPGWRDLRERIVFIPVKGNTLSGGVAGIAVACIVILIVEIWVAVIHYIRQKNKRDQITPMSRRFGPTW